VQPKIGEIWQNNYSEGGDFAMKKTKFTEEQIAFALKQAETGTSVQEVIRKLGRGGLEKLDRDISGKAALK
jgi:Transposase